MTEQQNGNNRYIKCNYCPALFFTEADLKRHMDTFGTNKEMHKQSYENTHGRLEHGYGGNE